MFPRHLQELQKLTVEQFAIKKPEYWDDHLTAPGARVPVPEGSPEWALVLSKFHVGGFTKPVHSIERVQVGTSTGPRRGRGLATGGGTCMTPHIIGVVRPGCVLLCIACCGVLSCIAGLGCCAVVRQNEDLWGQYYQERRDLEKRTSLPLGNEMWLLHGTRSVNPDEICRAGFDFRCGMCCLLPS
jgi:hypothetical protein